jgi:hypothetical protein
MSLCGDLETQLDIGIGMQRAAGDRNVIQIEVIQIQGNDPACMGAGGYQPAVAGEAGQRLGKQIGVADILDHHVDAAPLRETANLGCQVAAAIIDAEIGAKLPGGRYARVGARRSNDTRAKIPAT